MQEIKHLILDVGTIVNWWMGDGSAEFTVKLLSEAERRQAKIWVAASSLHSLDVQARRAMVGRGETAEIAREKVSQRLNDLFNFASVLSSHGFRQAEVHERAASFEDAMVAAEARSLAGAPVCIVTENREFDTLGEVPAMSSSEALDWLVCAGREPAGKMQFIDLKTQQMLLRPQLERNIERVLNHGRYIMGPEVDELEGKLAEFTGTKHCITCSSGTDALLIALMALGIGPGDEVITIPYTWISTAETIALLGAKPVFVDIRPDTLNMDPELIEPAVTPETRAVMPVGIYGQCPDMTRINEIAAFHGLPVIEDGAQSFGALHNGRRSCALSTIGCTSFFPSKPLGCYGDGGALFTGDDRLAETMRQIRVHGEETRNNHPILGITGRLDSIQAAVLLAKLDIFPRECELRKSVALLYDRLLSRVSGIKTPCIAGGNESVYAQYTVLAACREDIKAALEAADIPAVSYYATPLHLQGVFRRFGYGKGDFPVTEEAAARCLSLPMSPYMSEDDIRRVAAAIAEAAESH